MKSNSKNERKNEMDLERIGRYKGYEMYGVSKYDIEEDECAYDTMYVIKETGEIVFMGDVVGIADLNAMSVDEYPKRERYPYFEKKREVEKAVELVKKYDEERKVEVREVASTDDLFAGMDAIDKYISDALAADLIEPFDFEPVGI